ncbi:MAG: hypothetical protein K2G70_05130 [Turicibacter sp.]|nr:hypothetical protein [Turicibacter sp.]
MNRLSLLFGLTVISLVGCSNDTSAKNISTPQSLQNLSINTTTTTDLMTNLETEDSEDLSTPLTQSEGEATELTTSNEKVFATQQEFIDYMYEKVQALKETISLLDSNLTQVYAATGTEAEVANLSIRENLLKQTTNEMNSIESLSLPTEEVATLQDYVAKAYYYSIEYKAQEYEIFSAETLEERQILLDTNAENESLSQQYISLALAEIDRLSEITYYSK